MIMATRGEDFGISLTFPLKLQTPNSNIQAPEKLQVIKLQNARGNWNFEFEISLDVEA
jgi:hypothetical protein